MCFDNYWKLAFRVVSNSSSIRGSIYCVYAWFCNHNVVVSTILSRVCRLFVLDSSSRVKKCSITGGIITSSRTRIRGNKIREYCFLLLRAERDYTKFFTAEDTRGIVEIYEYIFYFTSCSIKVLYDNCTPRLYSWVRIIDDLRNIKNASS